MQEERARLKRRRQEEREAEQREAKRMAAQQEGKKVGDAGYRYHARIPRAARPDFIKAPEAAGAVRYCLLACPRAGRMRQGML